MALNNIINECENELNFGFSGDVFSLVLFVHRTFSHIQQNKNPTNNVK